MIRDDDPVVFNGELCYWGELSGNERMLVEYDDDLGVLIGSDPWWLIEEELEYDIDEGDILSRHDICPGKDYLP